MRAIDALPEEASGGDTAPAFVASRYEPAPRSALSLALTVAVLVMPLAAGLWVWRSVPIAVFHRPAALTVIDVAVAPEPPAEPPPPETPERDTPDPPIETPPAATQAPPVPIVAPVAVPVAAASARTVAQPVAPVAAPAPPRPPAPAPDALRSDDWHARVLGRLNAVKAYPLSARARHQEGVALIRFVVDRRGAVLEAALVRSSGFAPLDREAAALPSRADPLPAPPQEVKGERIELIVPVEFHS